MPAKILLQQNLIDSNQSKVDITMTTTPADLFGLAFHLKITGADWSLQKYELGEVFAESTLPLVLVKQDQDVNKIIFGLSFKDGDKPQLKEGIVVSFYLKSSDPGSLKFEFSDNVLAINDSSRVDLQNVEWKIKNVAANQEQLDESLDLLETEQSDDFLENTVFNQDFSLKTENIPLAQAYLVLFVVFLVLLIGTLVYFLRKSRLKKESEDKEDKKRWF